MSSGSELSDDPSLRYWKAALATLPPEKRDAAWEFYVHRLAERNTGDTLGALILLLEANGVYLERIPERYDEELVSPLRAQFESLHQRISRHEEHQREIVAALERVSERNREASTCAAVTTVKVEEALRDAATSIDTRAVVEMVKHQIMEGAVAPMARAIEKLAANAGRIDEATKSAQSAVQTWRQVHLGGIVLTGWGMGLVVLIALFALGWTRLERKMHHDLVQAREQLIADLKDNQDTLRKLAEFNVSVRIVPLADANGKARLDAFVAVVDPADRADSDTRNGHTRGIVYLKSVGKHHSGGPVLRF